MRFKDIHGRYFAELRSVRLNAERTKVPEIHGQFICIADREAVLLAAIISSYLYRPSTYLPIFMFPSVKYSWKRNGFPFGDQYMSNLMGQAASLLINNAWARLGPRNHLVLAGISDEQKSYLLIPEGVSTIEIKSVADVDSQLLSFSEPTVELKCRSTDVLHGLTIALKHGKRLIIDEEARIEPLLGDKKPESS